MDKVIKFFVGITRYHTDREIDPKQLGLWEEWLTKEFGSFIHQTVTSCWHSEYTGMVYKTQYCYTVSVSENEDYIHWDVFMGKLLISNGEWAERLEQHTIGLLIQDADFAAF